MRFAKTGCRWLGVLSAASVLACTGRAVAQQAPPSPSVPSSANGEPRVGYTPAGAQAEAAEEARATAIPTANESEGFSRVLSYEPHMAGTPAQARTRDFVVAQLRKWGLQTEVRAYDVYMPQPTSIHVWRFDANGDSTELPLAEGPVPGDTTSSAFPQIPTFNAYSGTGSAAGEVVYANYGLIEDYAHLDSVGVSVKGKIVIARYGRSFRGIKAREAERHGAAALLIYSDPADDGYTRGDIYPDGPMRPPQGVQRGSIMNEDGDPSTPGYPSTPGARRLEPAQMALPHIPVVPIGYRNAALLLADVRGTGFTTPPGSTQRTAAPLPQSWQGGLPFRYHVGPGAVRARVSYDAQSGSQGYHTIWDTFGSIQGTEFPDELIMVGGHRDAWGPGAADNVSGTVSVLEIAHALAEEARAGHRPKRTIVFASWDAEEWGLIGSTEYVEDDSLRLTRDAVAYLNLDVSADGPRFGAGGSPSLRAVLRDITRTIPQPESNGTPTSRSVFDAWRATATTSDSLGPRFGDPGGGSDFAGFANHLGIPILEYGFTGLGGVYHSAYDDFAWESRFGDPGFVHHAAAARIGAALLLRLANADVIPYDYAEYARTMRRYVTAIDEAIRGKGWSSSTVPLSTSIDAMERAATTFAQVRDSVLGTASPGTATPPAPGTAGGGGQPARPRDLLDQRGSAPPAPAALRAANEALIRVERALTRPSGLRSRPWFRSLIYASDEDNGYANIPLPSVNEAIRSGDAELTSREIADLASRFDAATAALRDATEALRRPPRGGR